MQIVFISFVGLARQKIRSKTGQYNCEEQYTICCNLEKYWLYKFIPTLSDLLLGIYEEKISVYAYQALVKIGINLCFYILWITHSWRQTWPHATANSIRLLTVILPGFGAYFSACQAHKTNGKQFASFIFPSLTFLRKEKKKKQQFF